ncbi:ABC transporter permease [Nocardioides limicola]|uniref:ABC transporter permease n=1 Tax=Nocardioides limicola TaxID=2803368 RepID=UPI00193B6783|nr:ABC transporter permease [Nocardioides sp. DJM-14]
MNLPGTATKAAKIDRLAELSVSSSDVRGRSLWLEAFSRLRRSPMAIVGAVIVSAFVIVAVAAPLLAPHDPTAQLWRGDVFPNRSIFVGPRAENPLGLDHAGRDLLSRMLVGARQSLMVGVVATLIGLSVGALIGGVSGAAAGMGRRLGRAVDSVLMRFVDMLLSIPALLIAISVAALLGPSLTTLMIAVGAAQVPIFARLLRGSMLAQSRSDFVTASIALGVRRPKVVVSHVLPNSLGPVLVQGTLTLATAIIEAAALSYLGLGSPDISRPEWGGMLADAQRFLGSAPHMALFPAVAIIITALGFTLLGEAMREALDPKLKK